MKRKKLIKLLTRVRRESVSWWRRFLPNRIGWQPTVTLTWHEYRDLLQTLKAFVDDMEYIATNQHSGVDIAQERMRKFNN